MFWIGSSTESPEGARDRDSAGQVVAPDAATGTAPENCLPFAAIGEPSLGVPSSALVNCSTPGHANVLRKHPWRERFALLFGSIYGVDFSGAKLAGRNT